MPITLKAARINAKLKQSDAAKVLGVSPQTLSSWELGRTFPDVMQVRKIQELYSVSYDDIIFLPTDNALSVNRAETQENEEGKE